LPPQAARAPVVGALRITRVTSTVPPPRSHVFGPEAGTKPVTARIAAAATLVALLVGEPVEEHEDGGDRVGDSFARVSEC
jgi:hypothetical protein